MSLRRKRKGNFFFFFFKKKKKKYKQMTTNQKRKIKNNLLKKKKKTERVESSLFTVNGLFWILFGFSEVRTVKGDRRGSSSSDHCFTSF